MTEPGITNTKTAALDRAKTDSARLDALRALGRALGSTLDPDQLLPILLEELTRLMDAERATLFLCTDSGQLESVVSHGAIVPPIRLQAGEGIAGWVAQTGHTVNLHDAYEDPRFHRGVDERLGFRTHSILCMPLHNHQGHVGGTLGVVQVLNKRTGDFDGEDEALLSTVATWAGISIENARLYQSVVQKNIDLLATQKELEQRIGELDLLFEIEKDASAATHLDHFLDRLLERTLSLVEAEAGSIVLEEPGGLVFAYVRGPNSDRLHQERVDKGRGLTGWVFQHNEPMRIDNPQADPRHNPSVGRTTGLLARNILLVPLESGGEQPLGVIQLINKRRESFTDEDEKLLTLVAAHAARAISQGRIRAARERSERLEGIGQLLSGVMHDLKTPMTVASGYAQLMVHATEERERQQYAGEVQRQFELMSAMTKEVLAFAKGDSQLLLRKVLLRKFGEELERQLHHEFGPRPIELKVVVEYDGIAHLDELKLFRLAHNLARNAAQAMPHGGTFTVRIAREQNNLVLEFSDTGHGLPEAAVHHLYEAFASYEKPDGTGLGLAIVKNIVDAHHGQIVCTSAPGKGTQFRITLPI